MAKAKQLIGLDIDPSGIAAAAVRVNGRISVDRAAVAPLEPGVLRDGEVVDPDALSRALRALWRDNKGLGKRVRIGVANQKIVVRVLHVPPTDDPKELTARCRRFIEGIRSRYVSQPPLSVTLPAMPFSAVGSSAL